MPTYDYVCDACGHAYELFQSMTDSVKKTCPKCGKKKLRRLIGAGSAIMFKGSGFYKTDYRSESYKKGAAADSAASGTAKTEGSKSEGSPKKTTES
ncbi:MAG: FmdB family transcriptional regulator [Planctomycetaceae bacterium]|nr:MAG: FmdB family transcriptional regulator [Planctomycetaceae bacterium]